MGTKSRGPKVQVRAYYRKMELDKGLSNQELLSGIYSCDINPFPAHLATLNLAARNISDEENYPRVPILERGRFICMATEGPDVGFYSMGHLGMAASISAMRRMVSLRAVTTFR